MNDTMRGLSAVWILLLASVHPLTAQTTSNVPQPQPYVMPQGDEALVDTSSQIMDEVMSITGKSIPKWILQEAQGIAIVPGMLKGGFIVGVRHGRGVMVVREESGKWKLPIFIRITGGSIGWQAGVQSTDYILVFKTKNSVNNIMKGKFTIGGDLAAAAGPIGREATAATDTSLKAEIYSYSRSRGLFAGASLDGSAVSIDQDATSQYYKLTVPEQPHTYPPAANKLVKTVTKYSAAGAESAVASASAPSAVAMNPPPSSDPKVVRAQLIDASNKMNAILEESWKKYLALPPELYQLDRDPPPDALKEIVNRYHYVTANQQYQALAQRQEFQETHRLLQQYLSMKTPSATSR